MSRPKLLDLFCCAGGAAVGYRRAGFDVVGVDIEEQPNYPFEFIRADALDLDASFLSRFDVIHASPPCQAYSDLAARNGNGHEWPDLIDPVREMLIDSGRPYVIENVEGAPLRDYVVLCGTMFPALRVIRHRLFEANFPLETPAHGKHPLVHTHDRRKGHYGHTDEWRDFVQVTGGGNCTIAAARDAMGIDWMTKREINEAIPPAYTKYGGGDSALGAGRVIRAARIEGRDQGVSRRQGGHRGRGRRPASGRERRGGMGAALAGVARRRMEDQFAQRPERSSARSIRAGGKAGLGRVPLPPRHIKPVAGASVGTQRLHMPDVRGSRRRGRWARPRRAPSYRAHRGPEPRRARYAGQSPGAMQRLQSGSEERHPGTAVPCMAHESGSAGFGIGSEGDSGMAKQEVPARAGRPTVRVKPHDYQPHKAELEETIKIEATPEELARAVLRPVNIVEDSDA